MNPLKILTHLIFILVLSAASGCKKYTCECTVYNQNTPEAGSKSNYTVKKKDKAKMCTDKSTQADSFGNYTTCVIK